jgi:serine/threonine-protein kinase RsbW
MRIELPVGEPAVEQARLAVLAHLESHGLDARVINRLEVILEELISNVVRHSAGAVQLSVAAELTDDGVELILTDDGRPFDPTAQAAPKAFTTLEEATPGGLGIAMVRRLSTSFGYSRVDGCNRVTVVLAVN